MLQACSLAAGSDHVPDNVLREAAAPHLSPSGDRSKDFALTNPSGSCPLIESGFHPVRNGHRANVATFTNQINNGPVSWRIWMSSNSKPTSSDLRKPQPNSMANIA